MPLREPGRARVLPARTCPVFSSLSIRGTSTSDGDGIRQMMAAFSRGVLERKRLVEVAVGDRRLSVRLVEFDYHASPRSRL